MTDPFQQRIRRLSVFTAVFLVLGTTILIFALITAAPWPFLVAISICLIILCVVWHKAGRLEDSYRKLRSLE